jgi:hypothetical protein
VKKPTSSVRFYKPKTEKTKPNRTQTGKKLSQTGKKTEPKQSQTKKTEPSRFEPVSIFFFKFSLVTFKKQKSNRK